MFCINCNKLAYQYTNKPCMRCQANITNTLSIICDTCSASAKQCSVCLKKIDNNINKKNSGGCGPCKR